MLRQLMFIAMGGAIGSVLRFLASQGMHGVLGRSFPYGTLTVNVTGSFFIGLLYILFLERYSLNAEWRAAIIIGLLGGYTTFSSFSFETIALFEEGAIFRAGLNIILSVVVCLLATWAGILLGRNL